MNAHAPTLALLCRQQRFSACWLAAPALPRSLPLQGQAHLPIAQAEPWRAACADLGQRLRSEGLQPSHLHWVLDAPARALWAAHAPALLAALLGQGPGQGTDKGPAPDACPSWHCLSWEWLAARLGLDPSPAHSAPRTGDDDTLYAWLHSPDDASQRQHLQLAREREHLDASARLQAERATLEQHNERLRAQNAALQQIDAERLASYLPALFAQPFTVLGAADLALLSGRLQPLALPNPYPEPSEETLRTLQSQFLALPLALQRELVAWLARLPQRQRLHVRPEMRAHLQQLEQG